MVSSLGQAYCAFCVRQQRVFAYSHAGALVTRCQQCGFPSNRMLPDSVPGESVRMRILCIDDDRLFLEQAKDLLEELGHTVVTAENGERGITLAAQRTPDLVLLDLIMPGLHGFEVCGALKTSPEMAGVPVVILTRMNNLQLNGRAFNAGAHLVVHKSAAGSDIQRLIRAVRVLADGDPPFSPAPNAFMD